MLSAPALRDAESGELHYLRCFVRRSYGQGVYIAECLDLDISTESATVEQAIVGLQDAVTGYVEVIFEGQPEKAQLVMRPSPYSHWLRYYFERTKYRMAASVFVFFRRGRDTRFYKVSPFTQCQI